MPVRQLGRILNNNFQWLNTSSNNTICITLQLQTNHRNRDTRMLHRLMQRLSSVGCKPYTYRDWVHGGRPCTCGWAGWWEPACTLSHCSQPWPLARSPTTPHHSPGSCSCGCSLQLEGSPSSCSHTTSCSYSTARYTEDYWSVQHAHWLDHSQVATPLAPRQHSATLPSSPSCVLLCWCRCWRQGTKLLLWRDSNVHREKPKKRNARDCDYVMVTWSPCR